MQAIRKQQGPPVGASVVRGHVPASVAHVERPFQRQIYAETSVRALGDNYLRALSSPG
jgi:hypothetical protein